MLKESKSPLSHSPPSIDLHGVSVKLSVACKDDSLYLTIQAGLWLRGTISPTIVGKAITNVGKAITNVGRAITNGGKAITNVGKAMNQRR